MDRRVIKTRKAIETAYLALIVEKKTTKITITEISKRANIDRKTFYLHYDTQLDVMRSFCKKKIDEVFVELKEEGFFDSPFNTYNVFTALNHMIQENISFYQTMAKNAIYDTFWDEMRINIVKNAIPVYDNKISTDPLHLDVMIDYTISGIISMYRRWLADDIHLSLEEMSNIVNSVVFDGLHGLVKNS